MHRFVLVLALAWLLAGLGLMVVAAPTVPYADPWRFLGTYLAEPFPWNVLDVDNGHCEVLADLVRDADLRWCAADQRLQITVGVGLAVLVVAMLGRAAWRRGQLLPWAVFVFGVFWFGNGRKLAHANESVPLFVILGLLLLGLRTANRAVPLRARHHALLIGCGLAATCTFGSGIACFGAFTLVAWLRGATRRELAPLVCAGALVACGLASIAGEQVAPGPWALSERFAVWLHWLGAPFVSIVSPLLDVEHAMRQPEWVRGIAEPIAHWMTAQCGPAATACWPAVGFGGLGLAWLAVASWRVRHVPQATWQRLGLGFAWFGVMIGVLVAVVRFEYFREHPDQVVATRYLPWSMLLWTGLLFAHVARRPHAAVTAWPRTAWVLAFALLLAPSQVWNARAAFRLQDVAERTALGAAVGVLDAEFALVESRLVDVQRALPALRQANAAMFAWPETRVLGHVVDPRAVDACAVPDLRVESCVNRLGGTGARVRFTWQGAARRVLVLDRDGIARGLARREGDGWLGWITAPQAAECLRIAVWREGRTTAGP